MAGKRVHLGTATTRDELEVILMSFTLECPIKTEKKNCIDIYYDNKDGIFCSILGYIINLDEICSKYSINTETDVKTVEKLYFKKGLSFFHELDGIYMIFLFDEQDEKGYIYQSSYGMSLPIYYYLNYEKFIFSTRLKSVLSHVGKKELNISAARDFMHYISVIPNSKTLVKNVYKLIPGKYLIIDYKKKSISAKNILIKKSNVSKRYAKLNLISSLDNNLRALFESLNSKRIAVTHTSGWDTNLLLYLLNKISDHTITTITIDGGEETNEVPMVREIQKYYLNLKSLTGSVKSNINSLVNIVWIYEGYIFQEGMFLRYELSKQLINENINTLFVGACGDQILSPANRMRRIAKYNPDIKYFIEFLLRRHCSKERIFRKRIKKTSKPLTIDMDKDMLLKMHVIMLNYHGVQGLYPFINKNTAQISKKLGRLNNKKMYYKKKIREILSPEIIKYMYKSSNVVDTKNLLSVENRILLKILNSKLVSELLNKSQITKIINKPEEYHLLILQIIYLYLFNELFISGRYNIGYNEHYINLEIDDFIN